MPDEGVDGENRLVGFDNAHEAELNRTCAVLQDSRRLLLELTQIQLHGRTFPALRPSAASGIPSFGIALDFLPSTVVSTLVPDLYSGRILREVGQNVLAAPEIWGEIVAEGWSDGIRTHIFVNGSLLEPDDLPDRQWSSVEIECTKGIAYQTDHEIRVDAMVGTAGLCLDLVLAGLDPDEFHEPVEGAPEGAGMTVIANRFERSQRNRLASIEHHGCRCWVCDLDFSDRYGERGSGYIQVHHIVPVAVMGPGYQPDPVVDLVPLCSNCHSMIHYGDVMLSPPELRARLGLEPKPNPWDQHSNIG